MPTYSISGPGYDYAPPFPYTPTGPGGRYRVRRPRMLIQICLPLSPRYRGLLLPFQIVHLHLLHILLQLRPLQILPGLLIQHTIHRVYTCQLEGDSWSDGCYLHPSSHTGSPACSPGAEVDPVLLYASADHDPLGSSS